METSRIAAANRWTAAVRRGEVGGRPRSVVPPQPFKMETGIGHGRGILLLFNDMGRLLSFPAAQPATLDNAFVKYENSFHRCIELSRTL